MKPASPWGDRNFRWLMAGAMLSVTGDQFTLIALPWLVLQLTGDSLALGIAVALMGIPRAVFILVGGAVVDRHSPKRVMMWSKHASALLLGLLAALTLTGHATLPVVYALALAIGLAQAFGIPSGTAMLPQSVPAPLLQAANAAMMGIRQVAMLAGPLLAALLLALTGGDGASDSGSDGGGAGMRALGLAFAVDCATFILSAFTLAQARPFADVPRATEESVLRSVGAGLAMVWRDTALRTCFLYWGLVAFLVGGTMQVALPLLADGALHGAASLGILMGAHGAGTLLGMVLSPMAARLALPFGALLLLGDGLAGLLLAPLGGITALWQAVALLLALGMVAGFLQVAIFTWIQRRVPRHMVGRAMSIFLFIFMGLGPLSAAATGAILQHVSLATLFAAGGALLACCALGAWLFTPMRRIAAAT